MWLVAAGIKTQGQLQSCLFLADKSWLTSWLLDNCVQPNLFALFFIQINVNGRWVNARSLFCIQYKHIFLGGGVDANMSFLFLHVHLKTGSLKWGQQQERRELSPSLAQLYRNQCFIYLFRHFVILLTVLGFHGRKEFHTVTIQRTPTVALYKNVFKE